MTDGFDTEERRALRQTVRRFVVNDVLPCLAKNTVTGLSARLPGYMA